MALGSTFLMVLELKDEGSHTVYWILKAFSVGASPTMDLGKSSCPGRQIWAMTPKRKYKGSVAQFVSAYKFQRVGRGLVER